MGRAQGTIRAASVGRSVGRSSGPICKASQLAAQHLIASGPAGQLQSCNAPTHTDGATVARLCHGARSVEPFSASGTRPLLHLSLAGGSPTGFCERRWGARRRQLGCGFLCVCFVCVCVGISRVIRGSRVYRLGLFESMIAFFFCSVLGMPACRTPISGNYYYLSADVESKTREKENSVMRKGYRMPVRISMHASKYLPLILPDAPIHVLLRTSTRVERCLSSPRSRWG